jgi:periplasmic copper chaperone A
MRKAVPILAMLVALAGCRSEPASEMPCVEMGWVRLPAVPGRPGAAYFVLRGGARETRLVRLSTPQAAQAVMHGPAMSALGPQTVPAGGELEFGPGDKHVMLFGLSEDLQPMSPVMLTFHFDSGPPLTEQVPAVPAAYPGPPAGTVRSGPRRCPA